MTKLSISEAVDPLKSEFHEVKTELQERKQRLVVLETKQISHTPSGSSSRLEVQALQKVVGSLERELNFEESFIYWMASEYAGGGTKGSGCELHQRKNPAFSKPVHCTPLLREGSA